MCPPLNEHDGILGSWFGLKQKGRRFQPPTALKNKKSHGLRFRLPMAVFPLWQGFRVGSFHLPRSAMGRLPKEEAPLIADEAKAKEPHHDRNPSSSPYVHGGGSKLSTRTVPYRRECFLSRQNLRCGSHPTVPRCIAQRIPPPSKDTTGQRNHPGDHLRSTDESVASGRGRPLPLTMWTHPDAQTGQTRDPTVQSASLRSRDACRLIPLTQDGSSPFSRIRRPDKIP